MKIFLLSLFLVSLYSIAAATNYYVKTGGNDAATGLSDATAWGTIAKVNSFQGSLKAGDSILFKRGNTFYGKISVAKSGEYVNHIVYAAYGQGTDPVITGFVKVSSWTDRGGGIFSKTITCESPVNMVSVDKVNTPMARWPKTKYLSIDSYTSNTSITDAELPASPDWTNAEVVIRKNAWIIDRNTITSHVNQTLNYLSASTYTGKTGFGYFIQNDLRLLTQFGEWFYNKTTSEFYMFFGAENPDLHEVYVSTLDYNLLCQTNDYITLENLAFTGSNVTGIDLLRSGSPSYNSCLYININKCSITYGGGTGINGTYTEHVILDNCRIRFLNSNGIILSSGTINEIKNSSIMDIAIHPGMGGSGDGTYIGVRNLGSESIISNNTLKRIGYIGIEYKGSNSVVSNNLVDSFLLVKRDGGAIYVYYNNTHPSKDPVLGRIVRNNIVLHGVGSVEGTNYPSNSANAYYIDGFASGVTITGNTAGYITGAALHGNLEADNIFSNNTIFESKMFLDITNWTVQVPAVVNNTFTNNIFVSPTKGSENGIKYVSNSSTLNIEGFVNQVKQIGTINNNFYYSNHECFVSVQQNGTPYLDNTPYDLQKWIAFAGHDKNSSTIAAYKDYKVLSLGPNKVVNPSFDQNLSGWTSSNSNVVVSWNSDKTGSGNMEFNGKYPYFTYTVSANVNTTLSGTMDSSKNYLVRFKAKSLQPHKTMGFILESPSANRFNSVNFFAVKDTLRQYEFLVRQPAPDATQLKFYPGDGEVYTYFDDISVQEATIEDVNIYDSVMFVYNASNKDTVINLPSPMVDSKRVTYTGNITLRPWTSAILFSHPKYLYTSIKDLKPSISAIKIYPNPASSQLWLETKGLKGNVIDYSISDIRGRLLDKGKLNNSGSEVPRIDISHLTPGIYLISLQGKDKLNYTGRFIVNR